MQEAKAPGRLAVEPAETLFYSTQVIIRLLDLTGLIPRAQVLGTPCIGARVVACVNPGVLDAEATARVPAALAPFNVRVHWLATLNQSRRAQNLQEHPYGAVQVG